MSIERNTILQGDALEVLKTLSSNSVQCCITSPPYYGLRDYGVPGQIGLEDTPDAYISMLVEVFREVRRVLRDDGTLWVNIGDSYAGSWGNYAPGGIKGVQRSRTEEGERWERKAYQDTKFLPPTARAREMGLKPKDLIGIPWLLAFALRADGWYLRQELIWNKPNCMPESVTDRCTKSHETIFMLSKCERYFYDQEAIKEPGQDWGPRDRSNFRNGTIDPLLKHHGFLDGNFAERGRNKRSVWTVSTQSYDGAHFATFPPKLIEPCILAGSRPGDVVLDCFMGAGTVALVASQHHRNWLGIELNPTYIDLAMKRIHTVQPVLWEVPA